MSSILFNVALVVGAISIVLVVVQFYCYFESLKPQKKTTSHRLQNPLPLSLTPEGLESDQS